jgi:hypothetical protein
MAVPQNDTIGPASRRRVAKAKLQINPYRANNQAFPGFEKQRAFSVCVAGAPDSAGFDRPPTGC